MRVLAIDPGMRITGYGCVAVAANRFDPRLIEAGALRFQSSDPAEKRLAQLHENLSELLAELKPDHVAVEKLYAHYKHPRTAIVMAQARGVILLAAEQAGVSVSHMPATEVKKSLTGNGHAGKEQIAHAVAARCGLDAPPSPPDVADALAIGLCAAQRLTLDRLSGPIRSSGASE
jgi:crossover junction endodeoxyribonuclease RuvC